MQPQSWAGGLARASEEPSRSADHEILCTLCCATALPGWQSAFQARFWPDCYRASIKIGPPAGIRPVGGPISVFSGSSPAKTRPGMPIYGPEALLRNIEYFWDTRRVLRRVPTPTMKINGFLGPPE